MDPLLQLLGINPPRFRTGDLVVFIDSVITHETKPTIAYRPNMEAVYRVGAVMLRHRKWHVALTQIPMWVFEEVHLRHAQLLPDEALAELLTESLDPIAV